MANTFPISLTDNLILCLKWQTKGDGRIWIQDGDPSQNSAEARATMSHVRCDLLKIPPRSPDLNPIENVFNMTSQNLKKDAVSLNITRESYEEFEKRVIKTMKSIPLEYINKLIASMNIKTLKSCNCEQGKSYQVLNLTFAKNIGTISFS